MSLKHTSKKITAVVITGGSSGIGAALIAQLLRYSPETRVCNLSRTIPANFTEDSHERRHIPCDLTVGRELAAAAGQVRSWLATEVPAGGLLLINNSGFGSYGPFEEQHPEDQLRMIDLNVRAVVDLTQQLLPLLKSRGGGVMNIASTASFQPTPIMATYGATKAFVQSWTLALADEWRGTNLHALCVCPGPTTSNFFKAAGFKGGSLPGKMSAEAVAAQSWRAWEKRQTLLVNGLPNRLLTASGSWLPRTWLTRLAGIVLRKVRAERLDA